MSMTINGETSGTYEEDLPNVWVPRLHMKQIARLAAKIAQSNLYIWVSKCHPQVMLRHRDRPSSKDAPVFGVISSVGPNRQTHRSCSKGSKIISLSLIISWFLSRIYNKTCILFKNAQKQVNNWSPCRVNVPVLVYLILFASLSSFKCARVIDSTNTSNVAQMIAVCGHYRWRKLKLDVWWTLNWSWIAKQNHRKSATLSRSMNQTLSSSNTSLSAVISVRDSQATSGRALTVTSARHYFRPKNKQEGSAMTAVLRFRRYCLNNKRNLTSVRCVRALLSKVSFSSLKSPKEAWNRQCWQHAKTE